MNDLKEKQVREEDNMIHIPKWVVPVIIGIFFSLVGTVYALTLAPLHQEDSTLQSQITDVSGKYDSLNSNVNSSITNIQINVGKICQALHINCIQN